MYKAPVFNSLKFLFVDLLCILTIIFVRRLIKFIFFDQHFHFFFMCKNVATFHVRFAMAMQNAGTWYCENGETGMG